MIQLVVVAQAGLGTPFYGLTDKFDTNSGGFTLNEVIIWRESDQQRMSQPLQHPLLSLLLSSLLSDRAAHAGHTGHAIPACVLSRSLEQTHEVAAIAAHFFRSAPFVISSLLQWSCKSPVSDLFAQRSTHMPSATTAFRSF
jgi:hypothetical protein